MNSEDKNQINTIRSEFFAVLGDEFMQATGYGMYAHLTHIEINRLFNQFLEQSFPARPFAKKVVENI